MWMCLMAIGPRWSLFRGPIFADIRRAWAIKNSPSLPIGDYFQWWKSRRARMGDSPPYRPYWLIWEGALPCLCFNHRAEPCRRNYSEIGSTKGLRNYAMMLNCDDLVRFYPIVKRSLVNLPYFSAFAATF